MKAAACPVLLAKSIFLNEPLRPVLPLQDDVNESECICLSVGLNTVAVKWTSLTVGLHLHVLTSCTKNHIVQVCAYYMYVIRRMMVMVMVMMMNTCTAHHFKLAYVFFES